MLTPACETQAFAYTRQPYDTTLTLLMCWSKDIKWYQKEKCKVIHDAMMIQMYSIHLHHALRCHFFTTATPQALVGRPGRHNIRNNPPKRLHHSSFPPNCSHHTEQLSPGMTQMDIHHSAIWIIIPKKIAKPDTCVFIGLINLECHPKSVFFCIQNINICLYMCVRNCMQVYLCVCLWACDYTWLYVCMCK
jgi:hypothetical protein